LENLAVLHLQGEVSTWKTNKDRYDNIKMALREIDGTASGLCQAAGFGISGVEPSGSAIRELVIFLKIKEYQWLK
jgi:hypothetical protein